MVQQALRAATALDPTIHFGEVQTWLSEDCENAARDKKS